MTNKKGRKYQITKANMRTAQVVLELSEGTGNIKIKAPEGKFNILIF